MFRYVPFSLFQPKGTYYFLPDRVQMHFFHAQVRPFFTIPAKRDVLFLTQTCYEALYQ